MYSLEWGCARSAARALAPGRQIYEGLTINYTDDKVQLRGATDARRRLPCAINGVLHALGHIIDRTRICGAHAATDVPLRDPLDALQLQARRHESRQVPQPGETGRPDGGAAV